MSHQTLGEEINTLLDDLAGQGREWNPTWIAHTICKGHEPGLAQNDDAEFWRTCGYSDCRREVTRCINRRAGDAPERREQIAMPGFEHLQAYYVVERGGEELGIPVDLLSDDELLAKAAHYRKMGAACFAHADDIDRFRRDRARAA